MKARVISILFIFLVSCSQNLRVIQGYEIRFAYYEEGFLFDISHPLHSDKQLYEYFNNNNVTISLSYNDSYIPRFLNFSETTPIIIGNEYRFKPNTDIFYFCELTSNGDIALREDIALRNEQILKDQIEDVGMVDSLENVVVGSHYIIDFIKEEYNVQRKLYINILIKDAIRINLYNVQKEYEKNPVIVDQKFHDKMIFFTSTISVIKEAYSPGWYIIGIEKGAINLEIPYEEVKSLSKGDNIRVYGIFLYGTDHPGVLKSIWDNPVKNFITKKGYSLPGQMLFQKVTKSE